MHLSVSEIKKLLKKWRFYKAIILNTEKDLLLKKLNAIESAINALDDRDRSIMKMKYFEGYDMDLIAKTVFMSRQGVYYRLNRVYKEMEYLINST